MNLCVFIYIHICCCLHVSAYIYIYNLLYLRREGTTKAEEELCSSAKVQSFALMWPRPRPGMELTVTSARSGFMPEDGPGNCLFLQISLENKTPFLSKC